MADNFGLKIGIEGEKDFKNALRDINSSFKVLGSEMNLVSSEFDKNDRSMESFTSRNRVLNKEIENQTQKIETLQKALNNASESFGENDKRTLAWQVQLNNAKADLNKLNAEVKDNHSAMEKAQNPTEDLAQDVKAFGKNADTAGSQTLKMGDIIKANLISEAIISGIKSLGSAMVDITRKFVEFAKEGVENASNLAESQNVVDVTFKDSASAINDWSKKAASAYGLSELEAKKYNGTIGALLSSSGVASDKLMGMSTNLVGLAADFSSFYNLDHDMAFDKIRAGISGETEPLKQLGINMSVANLQAYAMAQGIEKTYTNMTQAEQATLRYNYLLKVSADAQGDFARTSDGFANQQRIAQLNIENIATSIGSKLLPVLNTGLHTLNGMFDGSVSLSDGLKDMTDMILELVGDITERIPEFAKIGGEIITALLSTIINALPALIEGAKELLAALATGIMDNLPLIIEMGLGIIFDLAESIIAALPLIVQAGIDLIVKLALGIAEALPELIPKIVDAVILIVETLIDNIDMLIDASIAIIMALAEGLITALPILIEKLPIIIDKLIVAITDNLPKLLEMGIILILKLAEGLMKAIPQLIEKIPMIIASLISGFASLYSKLANVGIDLITKVRDGFVSKVLEFKDIGINMVKGLWEGIKNSTTWLLDKIKGFGADVMNGIKDFFGIHSPSSLMEAEVGKNLGLGVASGITKSGLTIKDAFKNVIPTDLDATLSYNANFLNPPERTNSIIDYSSLKRVFVEALKEMNLSVALDGYKVGEIIKNTVIKEVFA